ncbi:unnamed protein product [Amoebophrya sp. A120]|nr:unnamed protein product [Amoebophrya sp. A120]|eukprot:GSA120T00014311001.1
MVSTVRLFSAVRQVAIALSLVLNGLLFGLIYYFADFYFRRCAAPVKTESARGFEVKVCVALAELGREQKTAVDAAIAVFSGYYNQVAVYCTTNPYSAVFTPVGMACVGYFVVWKFIIGILCKVVLVGLVTKLTKLFSDHVIIVRNKSVTEETTTAAPEVEPSSPSSPGNDRRSTRGAGSSTTSNKTSPAAPKSPTGGRGGRSVRG